MINIHLFQPVPGLFSGSTDCTELEMDGCVSDAAWEGSEFNCQKHGGGPCMPFPSTLALIAVTAQHAVTTEIPFLVKKAQQYEPAE